MRKRNIVIFSIVLVVTAISSFCLGATWYYDNSKEMDKSSLYVREWYPTKPAFNLKDNGNSIVVTMYPMGSYPVRIIKTYTITDNKVTSEVDELHFSNKFEARGYSKKDPIAYTKVKIKDNILTGNIENGDIGKTKSDILDELKNLQNVFTEVKE